MNNVTAKDNYVLRLATENGHENIVRFLVEQSANITAENEHTLHSKIKDDKDIAGIMLGKGFDKNEVAEVIGKLSLKTGNRSDEQREYGKRIVKAVEKEITVLKDSEVKISR